LSSAKECTPALQLEAQLPKQDQKMYINNGAGEMFTIKTHACDEYAKKTKKQNYQKTSKSAKSCEGQQIICKITSQNNIKPKGHFYARFLDRELRHKFKIVSPDREELL
jgi:hypothetical protein